MSTPLRVGAMPPDLLLAALRVVYVSALRGSRDQEMLLQYARY